jgi:CBS domain containing-hemolysin-like protein
MPKIAATARKIKIAPRILGILRFSKKLIGPSRAEEITKAKKRITKISRSKYKTMLKISINKIRQREAHEISKAFAFIIK